MKAFNSIGVPMERPQNVTTSGVVTAFSGDDEYRTVVPQSADGTLNVVLTPHVLDFSFVGLTSPDNSVDVKRTGGTGAFELSVKRAPVRRFQWIIRDPKVPLLFEGMGVYVVTGKAPPPPKPTGLVQNTLLTAPGEPLAAGQETEIFHHGMGMGGDTSDLCLAALGCIKTLVFHGTSFTKTTNRLWIPVQSGVRLICVDAAAGLFLGYTIQATGAAPYLKL